MALVQYGGTGGATPIVLPARFTTTANISLSGLGVQGGGDWGGALTAGNRVLAKNQTLAQNNGVYVVAAGAWTRSTDMDSSVEITPGMLISVSEGTTLADTLWELSADAPITIGVTNLTFIRIGASGIVVGTTTISSGTSGAIPFNNAGVYGEDATKLFWDNGNDWLGIGTATPSGNLEVLNSYGGGGAVAVYVENTNTAGSTNINLGESAGDAGFFIQRYNSAHGTVAFRNGVDIFNSDNSYMAFGTNNAERIRILAGGFVGIGESVPTAVTHIKGSGATSATYAMKVDNSASTALLYVRDDGYISAGLSSGHLTVGYGSGFNSAITRNTFFGVEVGTGVITNGGNTAVGYRAMQDVTTASSSCAFGDLALTNLSTAIAANSAFGSSALTTNTTGYYNCAFGDEALAANLSTNYNSAFGSRALKSSTGGFNTAFGAQAGLNITSQTECVAIGYNALQGATTGAGTNTALGSNAGRTLTTASGGLFLGYNSGFYETESNKLFIDNAARTNEADGRVKALVYGIFAAATADQYFTVNGNVTANGRMRQTQGADVASVAGAIALGYDGNTFEITGTNAITLISNLGWQNGAEVTLLFTSTASIAHATATSGTDITVLLDGTSNYIGSAGSRLVLELNEIGGTQAWREKSRTAPAQALIDTTAGDSATINAIAGRFRKDTTGTTFTLTNSYITANSIVLLTLVTAGITTGNQLSVQAGAGSATITFETAGVGAAPSANCDVNFMVIN